MDMLCTGIRAKAKQQLEDILYHCSKHPQSPALKMWEVLAEQGQDVLSAFLGSLAYLSLKRADLLLSGRKFAGDTKPLFMQVSDNDRVQLKASS